MRLKEIRESRGMSQRQAALGLNLSPTVYNRYENGLREPPNALLPVIADFFGVSVDELLGRSKPPENGSSSAPKTPEARTLAAGLDRMSPEDRQRALQMVQLMFAHADYFVEDDDRDD